MAVQEDDKFRALFQALPDELKKVIHDLTFTAEPGIRYLDRFGSCHSIVFGFRTFFRKPDSVKLLHVDRESREQFAKSFYGGHGAIFVSSTAKYDYALPRGIRDFSCAWWLQQLPHRHRAMIRDIRLIAMGSASSELSRYLVRLDKQSIYNDFASWLGKRWLKVITCCYEDEVMAALPSYRRRPAFK